MTEDSNAIGLTGPAAKAGSFYRRAWPEDLKDRVVSRGIRWVCGTTSEVPAAAAADVPIVSGALRFMWLRALQAAGVKRVVARSAFGHRFLCHIGDVAEFPFYHRLALAPELALCSAWMQDDGGAVVYDVGANVGYFSTQLVQMLGSRGTQIYSFEPVPSTFEKLTLTVERLGLGAAVHPVAAAVFEDERTVRIAYSDLNSLFSQVTDTRPNARAGDCYAQVPALPLDSFGAQSGTHPSLIKIDVEGSEVAVLRGAERILAAPVPPAIVMEVSPDMLAECGARLADLERLLSGYSFHYVDDIVGQLRPFGSPVASLEELHWTCNIFAVPQHEGYAGRAAAAFDSARQRLGSMRR